MFGALGLTAVRLPCETGEGFENVLCRLSAMKIYLRSRILEICQFIMLPVATNLILYRNYREGSEAHCG